MLILFVGIETVPSVIRVGSRSSELAMIQTRTIISALSTLYPTVKFEVITMKTIGDKILDKALPKIGQTNLFTKELEIALAAKQIDMITHSLKDLPTSLPPNMMISVLYKRDSPTDAVVLHPKHKGLSIDKLPKGSVIGTSSLRRIAFLKRKYPDLNFQDIRGNLNTRLRKLDEGDGDIAYDAIVLATAGLVRMGWQNRLSHELDTSVCMYAVGQGALAVETRSDDDVINKLLSHLNDPHTVVCCTAERALLRSLGGGCSVPVGTCSTIDPVEHTLCIEGAVLSLDGQDLVKDTVKFVLPSDYKELSFSALSDIVDKVGCDLAVKLQEKGAGPVLAKAKEQMETSIN